MRILGLGDRPDRRSYAICPLILRADDGRIFVTGHPVTAELTEEELRQQLLNPIGVRDVAEAGAGVQIRERALMGAWVGDGFAADCINFGAPEPAVPQTAWACGTPAEGRFWTGPAGELHASRDRWLHAAAWQAVRGRGYEIARLMRWADPFAFETQAVSWHAARTEPERDWELAWASQIVFPDRGRLPKRKLVKLFRRAIDRLQKEAPPV